MVRSYSVVDAVVRDLMLNVSFSAGNGDLREGFVLDSAFTPGDYQLTVDSLGQEYTVVRFGTGESETGVVGDSIGRRCGFRWAPPASLLGPTRSVGFNVRGVRETSDGLIGRIVVNLPSDDEPPASDGSYGDAEELRRWAFLRRTPAERLAWLIEALEIAYRSGALKPRGPEGPPGPAGDAR